MPAVKLPRAYSKVPPLDREYLWPDLIPYGTVTGLFGPEGIGKGFLETLLAAIISNGGTLPDGTPADKGTVIMVTPEDDSNVTTVRRLMASGADLSLVRDMTDVDGAPFSIPQSLPRLREAIAELGNVHLVILDPLDELSSISLTSTPKKIRELINPLISVAEDTGVAILLVMHTIKDGKTLQGSAAIRRTLRQILAVTRLANPATRQISLDKSDAVDTLNAPRVNYKITGKGETSHAEFLGIDGEEADDLSWLTDTTPTDPESWARNVVPTLMVKALTESDAPMRASDVAAKVGEPYMRTRFMLRQLSKRGDVISLPRGLWTVPRKEEET